MFCGSNISDAFTMFIEKVENLVSMPFLPIIISSAQRPEQRRREPRVLRRPDAAALPAAARPGRGRGRAVDRARVRADRPAPAVCKHARAVLDAAALAAQEASATAATATAAQWVTDRTDCICYFDDDHAIVARAPHSGADSDLANRVARRRCRRERVKQTIPAFSLSVQCLPAPCTIWFLLHI